MSGVVTCPACGTQFRVTATHLDAAGGLVRCGSCLTVFRAQREAELGAGAASAAEHARRHRSVLSVGADREAAARDPLPEAPPTEAMASAQLPPTLAEQLAREGGPGPSAEAVLDERAEGADAPAAHRDVTVSEPDAGRRTILASSLLLIALLVLPVHYAWLTRTAHDDGAPGPLVALRAELCALAGCPERLVRDLAAVRSQRLVVRSHPERAGALRVDAVIINRGARPQPFPGIELRFSDMQGALLASRGFAPSVYLAGELAGSRAMPVGTPIRISFDLVDPGPTAVNYEMRLY